MKHLASILFALLLALPAFGQELKLPKADPPQIERGRGYNRPVNIEALHKASWAKHGERLMALPQIFPTTYDARQFGWVVPGIKDQVNCGTCWDFAGMRTVECAQLRSGAAPKDFKGLSEQAMIDCFDTGACNGDMPETVKIAAKKKGIPLVNEYPAYLARRMTCRLKAGQALYTIDDWGYASESANNPTVDEIKTAIVAHGVVEICLNADNAFSNLAPGKVWKGPRSGINHAINAIGWDDSKKAWLALQAWGLGWCDNGIGWVAWGSVVDVGWAHKNPVAPPPQPDPPAPIPPTPVPPAGVPVINSLIVVAAQVDVPFTYTITATNSPKLFAVDKLPPGLTFSGSTISGTPTVLGSSTINLSAANDSGIGTASLVLTVSKTPVPPSGKDVKIVLHPNGTWTVEGGTIVTNQQSDDLKLKLDELQKQLDAIRNFKGFKMETPAPKLETPKPLPKSEPSLSYDAWLRSHSITPIVEAAHADELRRAYETQYGSKP